MSIGLKRGGVRLEPHDPAWDESARHVIRILRAILGPDALDVQHVGSTAIPAVPAKPIVDLAVLVRTPEDMRRHDAELSERDILFRKAQFDGQLLYIIGPCDARTHYIHVVVQGDPAWENYLCFRDYLNACPDAARRYAELKEDLFRRFPYDRERYTSGKHALIRTLLGEARSKRPES